MFDSIKENIIQQCRRYNTECEIHQRYKELNMMVNLLKKDVRYKTFISELIEDCKIDKPKEEFVFDTSTFEDVLVDDECNHSYMDKRQFDILLVDKNRDAIAISYNPFISPYYPPPVDLKRFGLHHCIQLLFMPEDSYRIRPNDGNGRYYYQCRDFRRFIKKTGVVPTFEETLRKLHDAKIGFDKSKEEALKKYLELFEKAGYINYNKNQKVYVVNENKKADGRKLCNHHIAFWLEKVCKILKVENDKKIPWIHISPLILKSNFGIYNNLKRDLDNYKRRGQVEDLEKGLLGGLDKESLFPEWNNNND